MRVVILTGVAGAGKSTALHALEDIGYFCVDNLPLPLLVRFVDLLSLAGEVEKTAIVVDAREGDFLQGFSLDLSYSYNETPYWTKLVRIDKYGAQQTWVFSHERLPKWRFGLTEKAGTFSAPEITFFTTYRFGE